MQSRMPIYGGRRPLLGVIWVVMLWSRVRVSQASPRGAVTVTTTPFGSSGIQMCHKCATGPLLRGGSGRSRRRAKPG